MARIFTDAAGTQVRGVWFGAFLAVMLTLGSINYYVFVLLREDVIRQEEVQLGRLANVASAAVENLFRVTRISLDHIRASYHKDLPPDEMHKVLRAGVESNPFLRAISVIDLNGRILHSSRSLVPPAVNLSDQEEVRYFADGGYRSQYFTGPGKNSIDGRWQITVNIPIGGESGWASALVSAVVDPQYIYAELLTVSDPGDFRILMADRKLRLVARSPWRDNEIGESVAGIPLLAGLLRPSVTQGSGVFTSYFTGEKRVVAGRWLEGRDFVLAVSRSLNSVLASWRTTSIVTATGSAVVIILLMLSWRISTRAERLQQQQALELARMNRALQAQSQRAERLAEAKSDFLATMSHEIRTPLNGIIGYSGVVLEDMTLGEETRTHVSRVYEASNALRAIIDDILDFSKIEAGAINLEPLPFGIESTIDNCLSIVRPAAALKEIKLVCEFSGEVPRWVLGDGARMRQVVLNLLNNAVKFTDEGSVTVAVHGDAVEDDRIALLISVKDTGIGLADDKIPLLFNRFSQADSSTARRFGGTGLGLAICKRIIEAMGGEVGVESDGAGQGSTFWISLTLPRAEAPKQAATIEGGKGAEPLHILVVDDHEMNRDLMRTLLIRAGHTVDLAESGATAIRKVAERHYDLVLMDIQMPGLDGLETTRQIRALGNGAQSLPIVAMTANVLPEQVTRYLSAGMVGHIGKPIDQRQLLAGLPKWSKCTTRPLRPAAIAPNAPAVIDRALFDEVTGMLGFARTMSFVDQMRATLLADHWTHRPGEDAAGLRQTAHTMITTAGQLGLLELSEACRAIDTCSEDALPAALAIFADARARALAALDGIAVEGQSGKQSPSAA